MCRVIGHIAPGMRSLLARYAQPSYTQVILATVSHLSTERMAELFPYMIFQEAFCEPVRALPSEPSTSHPVEQDGEEKPEKESSDFASCSKK